MTDELGEYANIPYITQSVTFKTFGSQNIWSQPKLVEKTGLNIFK
jgi:hypothetical protein